MINIKENESLSKYTTFHLGGSAKYFVIVKNIEELKEALKWAEDKDVKYFILGGGSNLLFGDKGFDGLIIKLMFMDFKIDGGIVEAGAGVPLLLATKKSVEEGLSGLENLAGIPGTIGGAVVNNAGAYGADISKVVQKAEILTIGVPTSDSKSKNTTIGLREADSEIVDKEWFEFEYRNSKLKSWTPSVISTEATPFAGERSGEISSAGKPILLRIWLKLEKGNKEELQKRIEEIMQDRRDKEPKGFSAGCAFKNIKDEQAEELLKKINCTTEERERFSSRKAIPVAWFIEKAGLKGKKIGGAHIANEHANYIINDGTAKSQDVIDLIRFVQKEIKDKFEVELEEEVQIIQ
ncbi:UDP-N-acetylmuramate dehydrogenase [Patescibacteria group bacterium]